MCRVRIRARPLGAAPARGLHLVGIGGLPPSFALRACGNIAYLLPLRHGSYSCTIDHMFLPFQRGQKPINLYQRISAITEGTLSSPLFKLCPTQLCIAVARARMGQTQCPVDGASVVVLGRIAPIGGLIALLSAQVVAEAPPGLLLGHLASLVKLDRLPRPRILSQDLSMRQRRRRPITRLLTGLVGRSLQLLSSKPSRFLRFGCLTVVAWLCFCF